LITNPEDDVITDLTYNLDTQTSNLEDGTSQAIITVKANRPVKGYIKWGRTKTNNKVTFEAPRSAQNVITLNNLQPDTTYLYLTSLEDIFGKKKLSYKYEFITPPAELENANSTIINNQYNPFDDFQDFDGDGLTNGQEKIYNTSPIKSDSDGDGYVDGHEVAYGYDPMGPGRLIKAVTATYPQEIYAYNKARINKAEEQKNALILKEELEKKFNGTIPLDRQYWPIYAKAFIYGNYSVDAIYKSIIHGGKTVHTEINWNSWKDSKTYKSYITK